MSRHPTLQLPWGRDAGLRGEVADLRQRERRRVFPATLRAGSGAAELPWPVPRWCDDGLLHDLVDALLDAEPGAVVPLRLTRPGVPELHDLDVRVAAVCDRAFAAHGRRHDGLVVLTRYGWLDVRTGESRRWKRLRVPPP